MQDGIDFAQRLRDQRAAPPFTATSSRACRDTLKEFDEGNVEGRGVKDACWARLEELQPTQNGAAGTHYRVSDDGALNANTTVAQARTRIFAKVCRGGPDSRGHPFFLTPAEWEQGGQRFARMVTNAHLQVDREMTRRHLDVAGGFPGTDLALYRVTLDFMEEIDALDDTAEGASAWSHFMCAFQEAHATGQAEQYEYHMKNGGEFYTNAPPDEPYGFGDAASFANTKGEDDPPNCVGNDLARSKHDTELYSTPTGQTSSIYAAGPCDGSGAPGIRKRIFVKGGNLDFQPESDDEEEEEEDGDRPFGMHFSTLVHRRNTGGESSSLGTIRGYTDAQLAEHSMVPLHAQMQAGTARVYIVLGRPAGSDGPRVPMPITMGPGVKQGRLLPTTQNRRATTFSDEPAARRENWDDQTTLGNAKPHHVVCLGCGKAWPLPARRADLRAHMDRDSPCLAANLRGPNGYNRREAALELEADRARLQREAAVHVRAEVLEEVLASMTTLVAAGVLAAAAAADDDLAVAHASWENSNEAARPLDHTGHPFLGNPALCPAAGNGGHAPTFLSRAKELENAFGAAATARERNATGGPWIFRQLDKRGVMTDFAMFLAADPRAVDGKGIYRV